MNLIISIFSITLIKLLYFYKNVILQKNKARTKLKIIYVEIHKYVLIFYKLTVYYRLEFFVINFIWFYIK